MYILKSDFFDRTPQTVAKALLGKVLHVKQNNHWLTVQIIETEAYYLKDKASHASLGYTEKRKALFMPAATLYMYYSRGGDSLNVSCRGQGNAVLIKSGYPYMLNKNSQSMLAIMQNLNPNKNNLMVRPIHKLCCGQSLLCKSLGLKVIDWDQKTFDPNKFFIADMGYRPTQIIQTTRLGIPIGRDEHLPYRFIDSQFVIYCTKKPAKKLHLIK